MSTFHIDIDGTIAVTEGSDYEHCKPRQNMIAQINRLYDLGHIIIIYTGRGYTSGKDWRAFTEKQLKAWGIKYHSLMMGKPATNYFVDDKNMSIQDFLKC